MKGLQKKRLLTATIFNQKVQESTKNLMLDIDFVKAFCPKDRVLKITSYTKDYVEEIMFESSLSNITRQSSTKRSRRHHFYLFKSMKAYSKREWPFLRRVIQKNSLSLSLSLKLIFYFFKSNVLIRYPKIPLTFFLCSPKTLSYSKSYFPIAMGSL